MEKAKRPMRICLTLVFLLFCTNNCVFAIEEKPGSISSVNIEPFEVKPYIEVGRILRFSPVTVKSLGIENAPVQTRDMNVVLEVEGHVLKRIDVDHRVNSSVSGRVVEVLEDVGNHVVENQALLTLRSAEIEQIEGELLQAYEQVSESERAQTIELNSSIKEEEAQLKLSQDSFNRAATLLQEKIGSQAQYEQAKTDYDKCVIELKALKDRLAAATSLSQERFSLATDPTKQKLRLLGVSDMALHRLLETRQIDPVISVYANADGVITARNINQGEVVDPSKVLYVIRDSNNFTVEAHMTESEIYSVRTGLPVVIVSERNPDTKFFGKISYVGDEIVDGNNHFRVRARFRNTGVKLQENEACKLRILSGERLVLSIPSDALQNMGEKKFVYVVRNPREFEERQVIVGTIKNGRAEILAGLRLGEEVVAKGATLIHDETSKRER